MYPPGKEAMQKLANQERVAADLLRRRSNAARPIPAGQFKRGRSAQRQALREEHR